MKEKLFGKRLSWEEILSMLAVVGLFIGASFLAQRYGHLLQEMASFKGSAGILFYVLITIVAVVVAPISTFPLLPLAVSMWGSFSAALFSIIGWSIGAAIAFGLARRFGKPFIAKIVSLEKIQRIEKLIPEGNIFASILLLRMAVPVDVLSYGLGLFSSVPFKLYIVATIIGISPFAFIFSYAVLFPIWLNVLFFFFAIAIVTISYKRWRK